MGLAYKLRISVTYSENLVKIQITGNYQVFCPTYPKYREKKTLSA